MIKKALLMMGLAVVCSACAAPSLRDKTEVNKLLAAGKIETADQYLVSKHKRMYSKKDAHLFFLDRAALLHDADKPQESDELLSHAQDRIDDLYTKSVTREVGTLLVNDLTVPYNVADYERAFTFFYRAMNFLQQKDVSGAAVEARKAVFFLDGLRGTKKKGYTDDPFIQYFASLVFESVGQLSDARISRQNASNAYKNTSLQMPDFKVPANADELGEIILFHYNGLLPLKKTQTLQLAWDRAMSIASSPAESRDRVAPEVQNAVYAGLMGTAITISFPELEAQPYRIASADVTVDAQRYPLQKVADLSALAKQDFDEKMPSVWFRTVTRAVVKQIVAVQARHAAAKAAKDDNVGQLAGLIANVLGASLEKADTRQWFTLPAEIHMTRLFVTPGKRDIRLLLRDKSGNIVGEKVFEDVTVQRGGRVFLHYRSAY